MPAHHGKPVRFTFDGKSYTGLAGDTLASALLANSVHLMGRSFKYHRRAAWSPPAPTEPNALVGARRGPGRFEPNTRATTRSCAMASMRPAEPLALALPRRGRGQRSHGLAVSAGFYYKTFMWPRAFWDRVYEPSSATPPASASRRPSPTPTATPPASPTPTS